MNRILTITTTEYLNALRSKAFLIGLLAMPLMVGLMILVPQLTKDKVDLSDRKFAIVDFSGRLGAVIARQAQERNETDIFSNVDEQKTKRRQVHPRFIPELVAPGNADWEDHVLQLSDRVREKELFAFVLMGEKATDQGAEERIAYHTQTPTFQALPSWLEQTVNQEARRIRFEREGLDSRLIQEITRQVNVERLGLASQSESGEIQKAKKENQIATFAIPAVSMLLLFMMVMSSTPALLNSVLEEKMQKIIEVLLSSVTPFQLMMGKLLAAVLVAATLSFLYLGALTWFAWNRDFLEFVPLSLFFWFFFFLILAILIFGSMFLAIGSACSEIQDAQSLMVPAMLLVMVPVMTWLPILQSPTGAFARWMSLFPPATPMLMMLRMAIPPGLPWWEILLGVIVAIGFTLLTVAGAAKIFRIGVLSQGQTPSFGRMLQWLLSK